MSRRHQGSGQVTGRDFTGVISQNAVSPANLRLFFGCVELLGFGDNLDEPVSEAVEKAAARGPGNAPAEHFQDVLGGPQRIEQAEQIGGRWGS